jgi:tetratricopeptide (TPR) repeat protein
MDNLRSWFLILGMLYVAMGGSQPPDTGGTGMRSLNNNRIGEAKTRAVVIGISDYADPGIRRLNYAHRDALAFVEFLKSNAGGSLQDDQLKVLINGQATLAAIDDALFWLKTNSQRGDQAILYFAGHGDVELEALWQFGYLLSSDSPANNFRNNAVRVEDLDLLAIDLSSVKEVKTLFIIDACRSGTLSEGRQVPHTHLGKQQANEVRILSCKSDQVSIEGGQWGGGRGVFSYHLIKGLQGLAKDETMGGDAEMLTLEELEEYLKRSMRQATQQLVPATRQDPIIAGPETFVLATIDEDILARVKAESMLESNENQAISARGSQDSDMVLTLTNLPEEEHPFKAWQRWFETQDLLETLDISNLLELEVLEIPKAFLALVRNHVQENRPSWQEDEPFLARYMDEEIVDFTDTVALHQFNQQLAILLHNQGQILINKYLRADREDLAERSYHRLVSTSYNRHPALFQLAIKILPAGHPLVKRLEVKAKYYEGVVKRIQAITKDEPKASYQEALILQKMALAMDDKAPYIHNELGILYKRLGQEDFAIDHFKKAIELAPTWGLPYNNLCGIRMTNQQFEEAKILATKALTLLPEYYGIHLNMGRILEHEGDLFGAEAHYRKAGQIDAAHFAPDQSLGALFIRTTEYQDAEYFLQEASRKKQGFNFPDIADFDADGVIDMQDREPPIMSARIPIDEWKERIKNNPNDVEAHYLLGVYYLKAGNKLEAVSLLRRVTQLDTYYRDAWDHLAWYYFKEGKLAEAHYAITWAIVNEQRVEKLMLQAAILEAWERYDDAIGIYRTVVQMNSRIAIGWHNVGKLYEQTGRPIEAEKAYRQIASLNQDMGNNLLYPLYQNELSKTPEDRYWKYALAQLLYPYCQSARTEVEDHAMLLDVIPPDVGRSTMVDQYYERCLAPPFVKSTLAYIHWPDICDQPFDLIHDLLEEELDQVRKSDLLSMRSAIHIKRDDIVAATLDLEQAVALAPDKIKVSEQLAVYYQQQYNWAAYKSILANQYIQHKLKYADHLPLLRAFIHSGEYQEVDELATRTRSVDIDGRLAMGIQDLEARRFWLSGDHKKAKEAYEKILESTNRFDSAYSLARIHAREGKRKAALKYLSKAIEAGFNYAEIIMQDPVWHEYRDTTDWQEITSFIR